MHEIGHNLGAEHGDPSPMAARVTFAPIMRLNCIGGIEGCLDHWGVNNDSKYLSKKLPAVLVNRANDISKPFHYLNYQSETQ
jgi:hypothetical protein